MIDTDDQVGINGKKAEKCGVGTRNDSPHHRRQRRWVESDAVHFNTLFLAGCQLRLDTGTLARIRTDPIFLTGAMSSATSASSSSSARSPPPPQGVKQTTGAIAARRDKPLYSLIAGATAGAVEGIVTYPIEYTKTVSQFAQRQGEKVRA